MVYTTLTDRLGNNLFQIAAGASLAYNNSTDYKVCITDFELPDGLSLKESLDLYRENILRKIEFYDGLPPNSIEYVQPGFHYTPIPYVDNIRLVGYYQSEKYFNKEYIQELFSIDTETYNYINQKYSFLFDGEIVSLHVRRGDYVNRPRRQPVCGMNYFKNAINYIGKNKRFLIISDDIEWCKKKFKGKNFFFSENESPIVDLYLQSLCTHNIISNSSFSWWGAWLNKHPKKIVIAPKQWYGKHLNHLDLTDMVPESWIRINNPKSLSLILKIFKFDVLDFLDRKLGKVKFRG